MTKTPYPIHPGPTRKNWLERHPLWKIPLGGVVLIVMVGLGTLPIVLKVVSIHRSDVFEHVMSQARLHPELREQIGEPIVPAWFVSGELQKDTLAKLSIPVSGPRGKAVIRVVATKSFGVWWFYTLKAEVQGQPTPIDLLVLKKTAPEDAQ